MDKELKDFLEGVKQKPSSGISGHANLAKVQVEQIFALDRLTEEVRELNKSTSRYSRILIVLTLVLFFVAVMQFIATIFPSPKEWWHYLAIVSVLFIGMFFLGKRFIKDYRD